MSDHLDHALRSNVTRACGLRSGLIARMILTLAWQVPCFAGEDPPLMRLAVLEFRSGDKVSRDQASMLAGIVREELQKSGKYDLMDRKMMSQRMAEKDLAAVPETNQTTNLVKYGTSLDVQKIVGGQAAAFGEAWVLTIYIVDVNTGKLDNTLTRPHRGSKDGLLDVARNAANELIGMETQQQVRKEQPDRRVKVKHEELVRAIRVKSIKKIKPPKGEKGTHYKIQIHNTSDMLAKDVLVEITGLSSKGKRRKPIQEKLDRIRPDRKSSFTIKWSGKPPKCAIVSVGRFLKPEPRICRACKGSGKRVCLNCLGKQNKKCGGCKGRGTITKRYTVSQGEYRVPRSKEVDCRQCEATGKLPCSVCSRDPGHRACDKCDGRGKLR